MIDWGIWIPIIITIIVFILAILLFIFLGRNRTNVNNFNPAVTGGPGTTAGLYYQCIGDQECASGLICDTVVGQCKLNLGDVCQEFTQCFTGAYCSGVCVTGPFGEFQENCPCNQNLRCVTLRNNHSICLGDVEFACTTGSDCASSICLGSGFCQQFQVPSQPCPYNDACEPGSSCDGFGFCQPTGFVSGEIGAVCELLAPPPGTGTPSQGAGCDVGNFCSTVSPGIFGFTCQAATSGLGQVCNSINVCAPPSLCINKFSGSPCVPPF